MPSPPNGDRQDDGAKSQQSSDPGTRKGTSEGTGKGTDTGGQGNGVLGDHKPGEAVDGKPGEIPSAQVIGTRLKKVIREDRPSLQKMYGETDSVQDTNLKDPIERGVKMAKILVEKLGCSYEVARDLTVLTLYDVAILIDDSSSMAHEEGGKRKETLIQYIDHITNIYKLANDSGILAMRFMNSGGGKANWTKKSKKYLKEHKYDGVTRIGTELKRKILSKFAIGNSEQKKPLLVLIVTDGSVEGERRGHLEDVIRDCVHERDRAGKGMEAVTFQFSRIGSDLGAARLLKKLDHDPEIGGYIDVLPVEFNIKEQFQDKWFVLPKILLGAILPDWDRQDYDDDDKRDVTLPRARDEEYDSGEGWADPDEEGPADEEDETSDEE